MRSMDRAKLEQEVVLVAILVHCLYTTDAAPTNDKNNCCTSRYISIFSISKMFHMQQQ